MDITSLKLTLSHTSSISLRYLAAVKRVLLIVFRTSGTPQLVEEDSSYLKKILAEYDFHVTEYIYTPNSYLVMDEIQNRMSQLGYRITRSPIVVSPQWGVIRRFIDATRNGSDLVRMVEPYTDPDRCINVTVEAQLDGLEKLLQPYQIRTFNRYSSWSDSNEVDRMMVDELFKFMTTARNRS